jgi:hypothetical protein
VFRRCRARISGHHLPVSQGTCLDSSLVRPREIPSKSLPSLLLLGDVNTGNRPSRLRESQMRQWNLVLTPTGLGPESDCAVEAQQTRGTSPRQRGRPHINKPGGYSASNRNEYQKVFLGSRPRAAGKTDNFTAICEPTV